MGQFSIWFQGHLEESTKDMLILFNSLFAIVYLILSHVEEIRNKWHFKTRYLLFKGTWWIEVSFISREDKEQLNYNKNHS